MAITKTPTRRRISTCGSSHGELRSTTFYEPPHDITQCQAGPWQVVLMSAMNSVYPTCPKER